MYQSLEDVGLSLDEPKPDRLGQKLSKVFISLLLVVGLVGIVTYSTVPESVLLQPMQGTKDTWTLYKVTSSIKSGTYMETGEFLSKYISYTWGQMLGSNRTVKIVGNLLYPFQIHFVDTDVFHDLDSRTVNDWSDIAESYDISSFNTVFYHNKVQLYVPDLSAHYSLLKKDSIPMMKRLSSTPTSSTNNVAHIGIWMASAMTVSFQHSIVFFILYGSSVYVLLCMYCYVCMYRW